MARHTLSHAVDLYSGEAQKNGFLRSKRGLPIDLLILDDLGAPAVADVNGYVESLNVTGAANFSLKTATGVLIDANDVGVADVARGVQIVSGGADSAILTFTGTDKFGTALTEAVTLNGTNIVFGKKAFKKITQIASDGTTTNNINIGTSDLIGLTYRVENPEDVVAIYEDGAAGRTARAAATAVAISITGAATIAQTAVALTSTILDLTGNSGGTAATALVDVTTVVGGSSGSGMDSTQITNVDANFVKVADNIDSVDARLLEARVDLADAKVQVDLLVLESISYKDKIDKNVVDIADIKVQFDKLLLDVDLGTVGSFVKADKTDATTTTGDVRGTYNPITVLDGVKTIKVLLRPQARTSIGAYGVDQA